MKKEIKRLIIEYKVKITDSEGRLFDRTLHASSLHESIKEGEKEFFEYQKQFETPRQKEYLVVRKRYRLEYTDGSMSKMNKFAVNIYSRDLITNDRIAPNAMGERPLEDSYRLSLFPNDEVKTLEILGVKDTLSTPAEEELAEKFIKSAFSK